MKKKPVIVTLLGIRPDIIRMFKLIRLLDENQEKYGYTHIFCHTGQHFDHELDGVFYDELGVRRPDWNMNVGKTLKERGGNTSYAYQLSLMFEKTAEMIDLHKPDMVLYLGDTNSVISSVVVSRAGVPVVHVEAGGRSYDLRMPEEKCRTIIDHLSSVLYCYTERHKQNLLREGITEEKAPIIGNIIYDSLDEFLPRAEKSTIMEELKLTPRSFILTTLHREENTIDKEVLVPKIKDLIRLAEEMPVVFPLMPRVRKNLETFGALEELEKSRVTITKPLGYFDFLRLQKEAACIVSDSGTVQEEACILGVPALISRRSTERPETVQIKASILSEGSIYDGVHAAMKLAPGWDKNILNPDGGSPSDKVFHDLMKRLSDGYFDKLLDFTSLPDSYLVREAYGKFD